MKDRQPVKAQNDFTEDEGFIRLTTDEVKDNWVDVVASVLIQGERVILQQAGEEVAAYAIANLYLMDENVASVCR